jgi:hypothetical protein
MSIKEKYEVKSIDSYLCKDWFINKHYAKRVPMIEFSFGLYENGILLGVCSYGTTLAIGIRKIFNYNVYELNRLCVNDGLEKNVLSYFVSQTINLMPKTCVLLSYADKNQGHNGYIYQATNWIYTGLSAIVKEYKVRGQEDMHSQTLFDKSKGKIDRVAYLKELYGDKLYMDYRPRKHRYFYFKGNNFDLKEMKKQLKFKIEPYPKGENKRYDASYKPTIQIELF